MAHRIVCWFSCGTSSAVATKLTLAKYAATHDITIARCIVPEEHADNDRFAQDCASWFGQPVVELRSEEYASCEDVWRRERYMSGTGGARCTVEMKKAVRWAFEQQWHPDLQVFGYTVEERKRVERFKVNNPEVRMLLPLIDLGLSKPDVHAIVQRAGLLLPEMYRLGFDNANCRGCVAASSPAYWNRTRRHFPEVFEQRAVLSRDLGVRLVKLGGGTRPRLFLDQLDPADMTEDVEPSPECSLLCQIAEGALSHVS